MNKSFASKCFDTGFLLDYDCVFMIAFKISKISFFFLFACVEGFLAFFLNKLILAYNFYDSMVCAWQYDYESFKLSKY